MIFKDDSLTVVLLGDWNKLYIQPDWMARNIFEKDEIEIGVNGQGSDFSVSYNVENVTISPEQSKIIFSAENTKDETLNDLCKYLNNFICKAYTTKLYAYGLNIDYLEDDGTLFAEVLDSMSDTNAIVDNGYEIISTKVSRTLKYDDTTINMDSLLENKQLNVHFNGHYIPEDEDKPNFTVKFITDFKDECSKILSGLGYDIEGEE